MTVVDGGAIHEPDPTFPSLCASIGIDPRLRKSISRMGLIRPTLVQSRAIPLAISGGRDLLVRARTGSGKTLAYCLPVLHRVLSRKALIAERNGGGGAGAHDCDYDGYDDDDDGGGGGGGVYRVLGDLTYYCADVVRVVSLSSSSIGGGGNRARKEMLKQEAMLRDNPDVIVSTPAGLVAHVRNGNLDLSRNVQTLVVDEADLILSFGYADDVTEIMKSLPKTCQGFLMSATLSPELHKLKHVVLHSPAILKLEEDDDDVGNDPVRGGGQGTLAQFYLTLPSSRDKYLVLYVFLKLGLLKGKGLFFVNGIDGGYRLKLFLEQFHIRSAVLNSELPLKSRLSIIEHYNVGNFDYLIATDDASAARGREDDGADGKGGRCSADGGSGNKKKRRRREVDTEYGSSRGLDFRNVSFVVNVDLPTSIESYTHRIGRTARGGANGVALTLIDGTSRAEVEMLESIRESQPVAGGGNVDGELRRSSASTSVGEGTDVEGGTRARERQPCPLDFDLKEIEGFRYRVEDVSRAVTRIAIREARAAEVKAEILNSERLQSHFEHNPADLQLLQHDRRATHISRVQDHLKHVPRYMLPRGMQVNESVSRKRRKKKTRSQKLACGSRARNKANDPLQNFNGDVNMDGILGGDDDEEGGDEAGGAHDEEKFFDDVDNDDDDETAKKDKNQSFLDKMQHTDGYGKSTAGRNAWKQKHNKGKFNRKLQQEKRDQLHKW
ncbi:hypothetical protein ACHAXA_008158 [Cyclostephanos tholiformis]|uniref:RNA helicase n=1 Tax=Cyclostephanos tholiformis TaxID=382380 RepID=A0ABD3RCG8_9STRA